jgi:hypothetical protein
MFYLELSLPHAKDAKPSDIAGNRGYGITYDPAGGRAVAGSNPVSPIELWFAAGGCLEQLGLSKFPAGIGILGREGDRSDFPPDGRFRSGPHTNRTRSAV